MERLQMKKLSKVAYKSLFFKHLIEFLKSITSPQELAGNHAVAVSGGMDSMAVLWLASELSKQKVIGEVRAIFINHGTRHGQNLEAELVRDFCLKKAIPFVELKVQGLSSATSNFEAKAREARRNLFKSELRKKEFLWMGHHLDDSFEWSFMQRHRSLNPTSSLGIPTRNGVILRPFMAVSKAQIKRIVKLEQIPYADDPTNFDLKFDRNYIRHKIIPLLKKRYPKYLKFYAHASNLAAIKNNSSLFAQKGEAYLYTYLEGAVLLGKEYSEAQLQELIKTYSKAHRGDLASPIQRMLKAIENNKKGPFHFSGGVEGYYSHGLLMLYPQGFKNEDGDYENQLEKTTLEKLREVPSITYIELEHAWQNLLKEPEALSKLPGLILVLENDSVCKTLNTSVYDSLFPRVSKFCQHHGLRFTTYQKCLDVWMQKKEKLPKKLRLVLLSNLSHLFSSQQ